MKRKQITAFLLSSTLIVANVTPTLASAIQGPALDTKEVVTETMTTPGMEETPEGEVVSETTPEAENTSNVETAPEVEVKPGTEAALDTETTPEVEATPEVENSSDTEATPEVENSSDTETTPKVEVTPEAETIPEAPVADDTVAENPATVPPEEVVKTEIGEQFELEFSNFELTCEVTGENTVDVVEFSTLIAWEDCTNVTIPATVTYGDIEYKVVDLRKMNFLRGVKNLVVSEGIESISIYGFELRKFDSITLPSTLQTLHWSSSLADGTKYFDCKNWGVVNLPESNPYLRYDADKHRIFSKIEEVGPELSVGDTFEKDVCVYKVVEPGVVDVVDLFQSSDTNVCDIPGVVRYKGHDYKVRDCHIEGYKNDLRYFVRLSLGEGIRNVYWGYDPNASSYTEIEDLIYPSTLESIDYTPSLPKLKSVTIPDSNPHYKTEDGVLFNKDMTDLLMYPAAKEIDVYTIPASVTSIKEVAFLHTKNTKKLIIPATVKRIDEYSIIYTKGIETLVIENGVEHIGTNFYGCKGLKTAIVKTDVPYPQSFLSECPDLEDIYIEGNPQRFGYKAFTELPSLKAYHVSGCDWLSAEDGVLYSKNGEVLSAYPANKDDTMFVVPDKVEIILPGAFTGTKNLETLIMPKGAELYSGVVENPVNPMDVYLRDTENIKVNGTTPLFVSEVGGNIYVPSHKVLEQIKNANLSNGMEVSEKFIKIDSIELDQWSIQPVKGTSTKINATFAPYYATEPLKWYSEDESVATVDQDGNITAHKAGQTRIVVSTQAVARAISVTVKAPLKSISLNKESLDINKGDSEVLQVTYNPEDTTDSKEVTWESSDPKVATVDNNGKVTAVNAGETNIIVKGANNTVAQCHITVKVPLQSITMNKSSDTMNRGETQKLTVTYNPEDTTDSKKLTWESSDYNIVNVEQDGTISALRIGTATITAKGANGTIATCDIEVKAPLESISFDVSQKTINKGDITYLKVTYNPENTTDSKQLTWKSSDENVVTVDKTGAIRAVGKGNVVVTAYGVNGTKASCDIEVKVPLKSIEIVGGVVELNRGNTLDLDIKYNPDDTTDSKEIAWSVSDNNILSVNAEGVVTAKGVGKAFVYAKGANNVMASYEITVKAPLESISLDKTEMTLTEGTSSKLLVNYNSMDTTDSKDVVWNTDAKDIVSVDENGNVTAHKLGTATITATVGDKSATCKVTVTKKVVALDSIKITTPNVSLTEEETSTLQVVYNPTDTTVDRTVTWSSSNNDVASVDKNGNVTAHKAGKTIITAKVGDKTATCNVTVKRKEIALESIAMNLTTMVIKENCKGELTVSYNPTNTTVDRTVTWTSSDSNIASVDANGVVTGHKVGVVTITAKVGNKTATCVVTVEKNTDIALESIALNKTELKFKVNDSDTLKVSYNPTNTTVDRTVTWTSSNKDIVSVDKNGKVIAKRPGKATITAKVAGKTATCTVTVAKMNLEDAEISLSKNIFDYNGKAHKPSVTVKYDGKEISDYSVSYSNNVNAGTAKIKITGKGDATGTRELTFTIQKSNMQNAEVSGIKNKTFNGSAQTQNITVSVHGRTLGSSDYIVSYKNNVQPGTATMTIAGKGNYTGSKQFTYKVNMKAGWTQIGSTWYYGNSDGSMVKDGWVGNYYMDKNGVWVPGAQRPQWIKSGNRWWYRHMDGGYTRSDWELINGKWYYFDASGWMQTGWQFVRGRWYYMDASGAMLTGWQFINHKWYYLNSSGAMQTGWVYVGNKWYYLNHSGAMLTGWQMINGRWYYMNGSGSMLTGWQYISGKWYYMNTSGAMLTGWQKIDGRWYLLSGSGAMLTGWQKVNGTWYYMYSNGAMAENTWVGNYYVNASGAWIKSR